jgi:hypothetical protein
MAYQVVLEDLQQTLPAEVSYYLPPFQENSTLEERFNLLVDLLYRSKRIGNRKLQLVTAFHLGKLLECDIVDRAQRNSYTNRLSVHYKTSTIRLYYIFSVHGPEQLMRSNRLTLTHIRNLSQDEFQRLMGVSI